MLAKKYRLPINLFRYRKTNTFRSEYVMVKAAGNGLPYYRFGVLISKKVSKKATHRNKLRRIVLGVASEFLKEKADWGANKDVLIVISPLSEKISKERFIAEIESAFKKIHL